MVPRICRTGIVWAFTLVTFGNVAPGQTADWSRFRGPDGSAVSDARGVPTDWSDSTNLAWKTELPGPGSSSPIIVGDRVFVTCYSGYGIGRGLVTSRQNLNLTTMHLGVAKLRECEMNL